jgi:hypothetical protein
MAKRRKRRIKNIYKKEELIPLTVVVLGFIQYNYVSFTLKFLIENIYPDLKGLINTDEVDDASLELINSFDDPIVNLVSYTNGAIIDTIESIINIYGLDMEVIAENKRLRNMANNFYWNLVIDEFPRDYEPNDEDQTLPYGCFDFYYVSMVNVVAFLCYLLSDGKVNFEQSFGGESCDYLFFLGEDYSEKEHAFTLKLLQELGELLNNHHEDIIDVENEMMKRGWNDEFDNQIENDQNV